MEQSNQKPYIQVQEFLSKLCSDVRKAGEATLLTLKEGFFEEPKYAARTLVRLSEETEVPLRPELQQELLKHAVKARDAICDYHLDNSLRVDFAYYSLGNLYHVAAMELALLSSLSRTHIRIEQFIVPNTSMKHTNSGARKFPIKEPSYSKSRRIRESRGRFGIYIVRRSI